MKHIDITGIIGTSIIMTLISLLFSLWEISMVALYLLFAIIYMLFFFPPIAFRLGMIAWALTLPLAIIMHIWTVIIAWQDAIWKAALSLILPGIAELFWFIVHAKDVGTTRNAYCIFMSVVFIMAIWRRVLLPIWMGRRNRRIENGSA